MIITFRESSNKLEYLYYCITLTLESTVIHYGFYDIFLKHMYYLLKKYIFKYKEISHKHVYLYLYIEFKSISKYNARSHFKQAYTCLIIVKFYP